MFSFYIMNYKFNINSKHVAPIISYGVFRKIVHLRDATVTHYDKYKSQNVNIPLLNCDKFLIIALSGAASIYLWPYYLYKDCRSLELFIRRKNIKKRWYEDDNRPLYFIDHLI